MDLAENWLPSVQRLGDMRAQANAVRRATLRSILETDLKQKQVQLTAHDSALAAMVSTSSHMKNTFPPRKSSSFL
jgi:hypothetical protein